MSNATVILQPVIPFNGLCSKKERSYLQSVYQSDPEMDAFVSVRKPTPLTNSFWKPARTKPFPPTDKCSNSSMRE